MSKQDDEVSETILTAGYTILFFGIIFGVLWYKEVLQGWQSWTITGVVLAIYAITGWLMHDNPDETSQEYFAKSPELRKFETRAWLFSAPGWFLLRTLIRLFGGPPPEKS